MMNETDRELLIWAAKAAGIHVFQYGNEFAYVDSHGGFIVWNPLGARHGNGDALRLAVGLRLEIEFGSNFVNVGKSGSNKEWHLAREEFGDDPLAATRRAIVRAAAEIGRNMP
jgi:hypothetical protein